VPLSKFSEKPNLMDVLKDEDTVRIIRARSFREHSENTGETLRRVRSFKTTSKGLVNRGDSFETKRASPPNTIGYKGETLDITQNSIIAESDFPQLETTHSGCVHNYLRVLFTGAEGVGKSAIIDQFMTSEFLGYGSFNICK
jgi:Rad/Gem-related GTP binding protein 1